MALLLLLPGMLLASLWPARAQASVSPVPGAVRRELNRAEALLRREVSRLMPGSGVQILRQADRVILRVPARLLFSPDSEVLREVPQTDRMLALPVQLLHKRRRLTAIIAVYTDNIGGTSFNQALSTQRAQAVVAALQARGIPAARLQPDGAGLASALASNDTPEGRIENRRVEFVFERPERVPRARRTGTGAGPRSALASGRSGQ